MLFLYSYECSYSKEKTSIPSPPVITPGTYNYKLTLMIDFKKREKILKANGEEPTIFDKALSSFNSEIHAANVQDKVELNQNQLKISSLISPTTLIGLIVGNKKIKRESVSALDKSSYRTLFYFEERGDELRTTSQIDYKNQTSKFYIGNKLENTDKIFGNTNDILNIIYQGMRSDKNLFELYFNSSKSIKKMQFIPGEIWDIPINNVKYKARRYYKRIDKNDSASFEIWIDESRKIPLRYQVGLGDNYGATILVELENYQQ